MRNDPNSFHFHPVDGGRRRQLIDPVWIRYSHNIDHRILVPAEFYTDLLSNIRALWWLWPPWGAYGPGAVLHDYLWFTTGLKYDVHNPGMGPFSKRECDDIFEQCLRYDEVGTFSRKCFFNAVDKLGGSIWDRYKALNEAKYGTSKPFTETLLK